jgi:VanZ family protein
VAEQLRASLPFVVSAPRTPAAARSAWLWALGTALLLLAPVPSFLRGLAGGPGGGPPLDKLAHVVLFALVTRAWLRATRPPALAAAVLVALAAVAYGGLLELLQPVVSTRGAEWGDLAADAVGAGLALAVARRGTPGPL